MVRVLFTCNMCGALLRDIGSKYCASSLAECRSILYGRRWCGKGSRSLWRPSQRDAVFSSAELMDTMFVVLSVYYAAFVFCHVDCYECSGIYDKHEYMHIEHGF